MNVYIHMNDRIQSKIAKPDPKRPVIRVQRGRGVGVRSREDTNKVEIFCDGRLVAAVIFDPREDVSPTHMVKAWVEVYEDDRVRVVLDRPVGVAS